MAKISRFKLNQNHLNYLLMELWEDISTLDKPKAAKTFFTPFFTPSEPIMFAKRLEILKRLRQNQQYDEIMENLKVTPNTVSKMANILHQADEDFLDILDDLTNDQKERNKILFKKEKSHPSKRFWPIS